MQVTLSHIRNFEVAELRQDAQAMRFAIQRVERDHHAARRRAQLIDPIAAHIYGLGQRRVESVFNRDRLHILIVRADIGTWVVEADVSSNQMRKAAHDCGMIGRRKIRAGDNARLAAAERQIGCRVLHRHSPREVVNRGGRHFGRKTNAAHRRQAHRDVVHDEVSADLLRLAFVPHTRDETRTQVVHFDSKPMQQFDILRREFQIAQSILFDAARLPHFIGQQIA